LPEDGNRYEVLDGVLVVTPSPSDPHQDAVAALYDRLRPFLLRWAAGWPRMAPADVRFSPRRVVQPDLYVVPLVNGRRPRGWQESQHLTLAVEVLSPSTALRDRDAKRRLYQEHADEYWIVDIEARRIERWLPGVARPEVHSTSMAWQPAGAGEALTLDLPAYFREVWDE
jgi:Uma2 family endonuclease